MFKHDNIYEHFIRTIILQAIYNSLTSDHFMRQMIYTFIIVFTTMKNNHLFYDILPLVIISFFLTTCVFDFVVILYREKLVTGHYWGLKAGVKPMTLCN